MSVVYIYVNYVCAVPCVNSVCVCVYVCVCVWVWVCVVYLCEFCVCCSL